LKIYTIINSKYLVKKSTSDPNKIIRIQTEAINIIIIIIIFTKTQNIFDHNDNHIHIDIQYSY